MKLVFIASPFRAHTDWQRAENVRHAERIALQVWQAGACAVCPQAMSQHFHGEGPDQRYLDGYISLLRRCDAVIVGGQSDGVARELEVAAEQGLPVFREVGELIGWLDREEAPLFANALRRAEAG